MLQTQQEISKCRSLISSNVEGNLVQKLILVHNRKEGRFFFYLTTHSTHFIYRYMASDIW